jgi:RNA polymerase sigma-70 factor, ECF subfamily
LNNNLDTIIKGCLKHDLQSQEQLYKLCYAEMIKICYRYAKDTDAVGIVFNDAMLKVFKNLDSYKEEGKFMGWIKTIVVNTCLDYCKKQTAFNNTSNNNIDENISIEPEVFNNVSAKEIQLLIKKLPLATATVFNMYVYEGYTHKQIGEILHISDGTSKWHLSEAKKNLKIKLEKLIEIEF